MRERLVFVRTLDIRRPRGRAFRVAVWRRTRGEGTRAVSDLWSAAERALFRGAAS